ncbi:hypothetical protein F511_14702 [Dorcoceras hygrometricum]|uniref:Uncharacterized protein n=1 Tax=Dorcoceras hygrometricum TaxID=472368 RepID=A0A2Z7BJF0_9LAMI|nr:hypothetical protein F511_14702 [Dorcoceras hygrometricum]
MQIVLGNCGGFGSRLPGVSRGVTLLATGAWLQPESQGDWLFTVGGGRLRLIRSTTGTETPSSACTRKPDEIRTDENSLKSRPKQIPAREAAAWWPTAAAASEESREAAENLELGLGLY